MPSRPLSAALLTAALTLATSALAPAHADEAPMQPLLVRGGALQADPVAHDGFAHIPTGRVVSTWDYSDPGSPRQVSTTAPVDGVINGIARRGDYLYASWRGTDEGSGLAVYSLADPAAPELVADIQDYTDEVRRQVAGVAVTDGHLYLFDARNGIFVSDLADPAQPELLPTSTDGLPVIYSRLAAFDDTIHAVGRTLMGTTVLHLFDVSEPYEPFHFASHQVSGVNYQSLIPEGDNVFGIGMRLSAFDLSEPSQMVLRGDIAIPPAFTGARVGDHFYTFGAGPGVDIWNVADVDDPVSVGHLDIPVLGTRRRVAMDDLLILPNELDRVQAIDASTPAAPVLASTGWMPGGSVARDIARHGDALVLLQPDYGLTVVDPDTLAVSARFDADLPEELAARSFQQFTLQDDVAYLTSWGYGLITVDLSDPAAPVELGRTPFPFAATLAMRDGYAYVTRSTNGRYLGVLDISDPAAPETLHHYVLDAQAYRLRIDGQHLYTAESFTTGNVENTGGLRVYSLADPSDPVEMIRLDDDCNSAFDLAIDSEVSLLYLACAGGMQVIDIVDPENPTVVASYDAGANSSHTRVEQRGDRAWFANHHGLHTLDVSDPLAPVFLSLTPLGGQSPERLSLLDDGRLYALGGNAGVHVFELDADGGHDATPLANGAPVTGLEGGQGEELLFSIEVPAGAGALQVLSYGGRGDVDLLVRHGQPPTTDEHDASSTRPGNNQTVHIASPAAGTYYIKLTGTQPFSDVSLQARH